MRILVIEDDARIASFLEKGFKEAGFVVDVCREGRAGLRLARSGNHDAAVIDLMLPGIDGLTIIERMRAERITTPVIILSARSSVGDRVKGLQTGGDDYLVKPFSFSELLARVQALIRRSGTGDRVDGPEAGGRDEILRYGGLELDPWKREARRDGQAISLHAREFALLELLMRHPERVHSKTMILENVYDYNFDPQTNVVDVLVHRLRKKVDEGFEPKLIHTVRGMGYVLRDESEDA